MVINNRVISYKNFLHDESVILDDSQEFIDFINAGHDFLIENIAAGRPIYGVTTGYGEAGQNYAAFEEAQELQKNLYSFHGCGVGAYLSQEVARIMVTIRLISLSKGKSGVSYDLQKLFILDIQQMV